MPGHRRRRATKRSPPPPLLPKGCGGTPPSSVLRLLDDGWHRFVGAPGIQGHRARNKPHRIYGRERLVYSGDKGAVLLVSILGLLLLTLLGLALTTNSIVTVNITANARETTEAFYIADSGISHARGIISGQTLARIIHQRRKKRLTEPGFTTKDAVTGCWEVCAAEIGRWEVKNGVFGTQHSRRQLRNRVFGTELR